MAFISHKLQALPAWIQRWILLSLEPTPYEVALVMEMKDCILDSCHYENDEEGSTGVKDVGFQQHM
eukprot:2728508-Ditylum_brightwellii.AAC.1